MATTNDQDQGRTWCNVIAPQDHDVMLPNGNVLHVHCMGFPGHDGPHYNGTHEWWASIS